MRFEFHKYHGTGNDFIMINDLKAEFPADDQDLIRKLCERRFGIGADGLILIRSHKVMDFSMLYFNADGKKGSMCGNGGRCAVAFAHEQKICGESVTFEAIDGTHVAKIQYPDLVQLKMQSVRSVDIRPDHYELDTGSPHYVTFAENVESLDVYELGKKIRLSNAFRAEGINVNFVEHKPGRLFVRTYERGVENETFSCGTGAVAAAICASLRDTEDVSEYSIDTRGGTLSVSFRREEENVFRNIILEGPAEFVFRGNLNTN